MLKFLVFAIFLVDVLFVYFCFCFLCLRRQIPPKILLRSMSKNVLPMLSSSSFMVLDLTFRSSIYFESNVACSKRKCSNFSLLHFTCSFSIFKPLSEETLFPNVYSYLLCCKLIDHMCVGLFLSSIFCSMDLCLFFFFTILL